MLDLTLIFETNLKFMHQPQISMETLFIKLSMMDSSIDIKNLLNTKELERPPIKKIKSIQSHHHRMNKRVSVPSFS